jgi:NTE family protein
MTNRKMSISRRELLAAASILAVPAFSASAPSQAMAQAPDDDSAGNRFEDTRIGLALGAGGANGLAHIEMLEVLDRLELRPYRIAGSSIGAVIGALFASGLSAAEIRELATSAFGDEDSPFFEKLISEQATHWLELVEIEVGNGGLLDSQRILSHFYQSLDTSRFSDLDIPLDIVAGDLWDKQQVVLNSGALLPAVQASMAIPGVFEPVRIDDRVLIDGGTVNPVPWDLLFEDCNIVIGVDVSGVRSRSESGDTGYLEVLFNSVKVMQHAIVKEKMRHRKPDIFIAPKIRDIRALEFYNAADVFEQAQPAKAQLERELKALLAA